MPLNVEYVVHSIANVGEAFGSGSMRSTECILQCPNIVATTKNGIDTFVVALSRSPIKRTERLSKIPQRSIAGDHVLRSRHGEFFIAVVIYFDSGPLRVTNDNMSHIFKHPSGGATKTGMGVE